MTATPLSQETFLNGYRFVLQETFEGPRQEGAAYLDQDAGLFQTLEAFTAERASTPPAPGINTIAAHTDHTRFHLATMNAFARGEAEQIDWEATWSQQRVDDQSWQRLISELRSEYHTLQDLMQSHEHWDERAVAGLIGTLAHLSYHLGAIRQLMQVLDTGENA